MASVAGLVPMMKNGACAHEDKKSIEPLRAQCTFFFMGPTQAPFFIMGPTQALPHIRHEAGRAFRMFMQFTCIIMRVFLCKPHRIFIQAAGVRCM